MPCLSLPVGTHNEAAYDCKPVVTECRQTAGSPTNVTLSSATYCCKQILKCRPNDTISYTHVTQFSIVSLELQYKHIFIFSYRRGHIFLTARTTIQPEEKNSLFPMTYQRMQLS
jgi:hypothetical protein